MDCSATGGLMLHLPCQIAQPLRADLQSKAALLGSQCLHCTLLWVSHLTSSFLLLWTECTFAAGAHQVPSWECILWFSFMWKESSSCAPSPLCFVTKTVRSIRRCTSKNMKSKVFSHKQRSVSVFYSCLCICSFQFFVMIFTHVVSWLCLRLFSEVHCIPQHAALADRLLLWQL